MKKQKTDKKPKNYYVKDGLKISIGIAENTPFTYYGFSKPMEFKNDTEFYEYMNRLYPE